MDLERFCFRVLFTNTLDVVLSTYILVVGYGCPISIRVVCSGTASCAFVKDAPIPDSTVDAMKCFMI